MFQYYVLSLFFLDGLLMYRFSVLFIPSFSKSIDHIMEKHDDSWRGTKFVMRLFWRLCEKVIIECGQANLLDARDVTHIL